MATLTTDNSYATLAEAEAYLSNHLFADTWSALTDDAKEQTLITATMLVDLRFAPFAGSKYESNQPLAFPRDRFFYWDALEGALVEVAADTIPQQIKTGTILLANHLAVNKEALFGPTEASDWSSITLDDISISDSSKGSGTRARASTVPYDVTRLIGQFSRNKALLGSIWWRAN